MLLPIAVATISLLPVEQGNLSQDSELFTYVNAIAYADNNSAYHLAKGHEINYKPGESAFTQNEFAIGTRYKNFFLSYIYRYDWFLSFSKDTMEFYNTVVNNTSATAGKNYDIDLKVSHINTEGLRLAYLHEMDNVNLYVAGSYLKARELMDGELTGDVLLSGDCESDINCYTGDLNLDYTYSEDVLLDRETDKPESLYGYGFDIGADWRINKNWSTSLYIQDLISKIVWDDAPYTEANATTSRTVIIDDYYHIEPVVSGYERNEDFTQRLPVKYNALVAYDINDKHHAYIQGFYAFDSLIAHLGYRYLHGNSLYGARLYPIQHAIGIDYRNRYFNFGITSKPFDYENSELVSFNLGINIPLF